MAGASPSSTTQIRHGLASAKTARRANTRLPLPFLAAAVLAVSACTPQQPTPPASPAAAAPGPVTIEVNQSRDQYGQHSILLQLTNTTDGLLTVDLARVNQLRDGYNRYYVLEKECAVRSPKVARQGFRPLPPLTTADLAAELPPLTL